MTITDDEFHSLAQDGDAIMLDVPSRTVTVAGKTFDFRLSEREYHLTVNNGAAESYRRFGKGISEEFTMGGKKEKVPLVRAAAEGGGEGKGDGSLPW